MSSIKHDMHHNGAIHYSLQRMETVRGARSLAHFESTLFFFVAAQLYSSNVYRIFVLAVRPITML
jgi:hypothetical protein